MFAVMKTGGKQYRVQSGDVLRVEKLAADAGDTIQFNEVLMVGSTVGEPMVEGAGVQAEVIDQIKGPKTINFVKRRRKHSSKRTKGHRQKLTLVRIKDILEKGAEKSGVKAAIGSGSVPYASLAVVEAAPVAKKLTTKKASPAAVSKPAAAEQVAVAKPAAEKTAVKKVAVAKPAAEKTAAKKVAVAKPVAEKIAAKKPTAKKPAVKKPAAEKE